MNEPPRRAIHNKSHSDQFHQFHNQYNSQFATQFYSNSSQPHYANGRRNSAPHHRHNSSAPLFFGDMRVQRDRRHFFPGEEEFLLSSSSLPPSIGTSKNTHQKTVVKTPTKNSGHVSPVPTSIM